MKARLTLIAGAVLAAASAGAFAQQAQQAAPADAAPTVNMRLATSQIGSTSGVESAKLKAALASLSVVAIVGESAIMKTETAIPGLPRDLTVRNGRTFAVLGVPVTPHVTTASVEFSTSTSATPLSISRLGEAGAEVIDPKLTAPESADLVWQVASGSSIRNAVTEWSQRAGWAFVWGLDEKEDFLFQTGNKFTGDFRTAIYGLFNSLPTDVKVRAELRPDNTPPMVLITRDEGIR